MLYRTEDVIESKVKIAYEYDSHGNWIKRTASEMPVAQDKSPEKVFEVTYRTIAY